ncbi:hypothetical protein C475_01272 [Halosimplex carlsbadense 2-9-1]|uniref:Uncharacterized protein n=1 Tax=Halosimplex carlsbadense 2-9-1 TaxID=797114 RepID=M0D638_9EURY|nr:hypothetical protein [Halosimplex carlsbadense]ELZ30323.1 hypothetical protein C475_01272 [Halosimplex carlsbadense 2-9-1]
MERDTSDYGVPELTEYGSVEAITEQQFNKDGMSTDQYTDDTNGEIVGSLSEYP